MVMPGMSKTNINNKSLSVIRHIPQSPIELSKVLWCLIVPLSTLKISIFADAVFRHLAVPN